MPPQDEQPTAPATGTEGGAAALFARALAVALPLVAARVFFRAVKDGYLDADLARLLARNVARHWLLGLAYAVVPALLLCLLYRALSRRAASRPLAWLLVLATAALGYAFAAFRLPPQAFYTPGTDTTTGWIGHGAAAGAGLVAALFVPRLVRGRLLAVAAGVPVLLGAAAAGALLLWPAADRGGRPNVILISLDTLRRDHIGCYGYGRPTTPELDRFAADCVRFDHAFSPQSWTLTAHMSMLTGVYPSVHGLSEETSLPRSIPTLAEKLNAAGFHTFGVVDRVPLLHPRFGFGRGFDYYEQLPDYAAMKVERILGLLDDVGDEPFFLFAHFYDAHSDWRRLPYEATDGDLADFAPWYGGDELAWCRTEDLCASRLLVDMAAKREVFDSERRGQMIDLYDAGVRSLDRQFGRLVAGLEARGLLEDSVVLITADHGEEFFDHGQPLHGQTFDECLSVPFFLRAPGSAGGSSDQLVSHVDILPTLLELGGAPPSDSQGVSLAPLLLGEGLPREREAVVVQERGGPLGLRTKRWSLISVQRELRLFDVLADPLQTVDLIESESVAAYPELELVLERENTASDALRRLHADGAGGVDLSAEEQSMLEALGYAGD
ncbi:MAG: sulfatase [Planctomycetota bacterium]